MNLLAKIKQWIAPRPTASGREAPEVEAKNRVAKAGQPLSQPAVAPIIVRPTPQPAVLQAKLLTKPAPGPAPAQSQRAPVMPRPSREDAQRAAEFETNAAFAALLPHFQQAARQLRIALPALLKDILQQRGDTLTETVARSFEGQFLAKLSSGSYSAVAEDSSQERAVLKAAIAMLPALLSDEALVESALKRLEVAKISLANLMQYHLMITGVFPLVRVTRQAPGDYEVEFRALKVQDNALLRGAVLGNWISSNLQDAYSRGSRDAMVRLIAAKLQAAPSRANLLAWVATAGARAAARSGNA